MMQIHPPRSETMSTQVRETTLLDLVVELQRRGIGSEREIVAMVSHLLRTGQIRLCGIYAKTRYTLS